VTYALCAHVFLVLVELFTVFYGAVPDHTSHFRFLLFGTGGKSLMLLEWGSIVLAILSMAVLINPRARENDTFLFSCCIALFVSIWMEKGLAMIVTGFVPSPLGRFTAYKPTLPELLIAAGVYGIGAFLITVFSRIFTKTKSVAESC